MRGELQDRSGWLVVPLHNEEKRWDAHYWLELVKSCNEHDVGVIFVNDGSSDSTEKLIFDLTITEKSFKLCLERNVGKGNAIRLGFNEIIRRFPSAKFLGFLDGDGAFSVSDLLVGFEKMHSTLSNTVIGSRVRLAGHSILRRTHRHTIGRLISTLLNLLLFDTTIYDPQSGLKVFRNSSDFRSALSTPFLTKWFFDVELILRLSSHANPILEFPVTSWVDVPGGHLKLRSFPLILQELFTVLFYQRLGGLSIGSSRKR